ncbi:MAG: N-acetylmuramoyl-L-alanine amidase [Candidatus Aminicenantales bacterium]
MRGFRRVKRFGKTDARLSAAAGLLAFLLTAAPPSLPAAASPLVEVYNLRYYTHPNFTRIVLDLGELREYTYGELHAPDRLFVDILAAKLNPILHGQSYSAGTDYLSHIRIAQRDRGIVRLAVDLDFAKIKSYRVYYLPDPFRIVMDIYPGVPAPASQKGLPPPETTAGTAGKTGPETKAGPEAKPQPAQPTESGYTLVRQLGLKARTIVIDPGHGGTDPGCLGRNGEQEKDLVLDVCLRLQKLLSAVKDLQVLLTRETDIFIPLENRTVTANQNQADLFISVHANSSLNPKRTGIETFYLNLSTDPAVEQIAVRENAATNKSISKMKDILLKIMQNNKIPESRDLAEKVQRNLAQYLSRFYGDIQGLGAKGGPFWVLIGGEMPSVLVEISHLSNAQEAARLKDETYRQRVAEGIYQGIMAYMKSLGKST